MDSLAIAIMVPSIVFMVFVAPAWVWLHYRSKRKAQGPCRKLNGQILRLLCTKQRRCLSVLIP